MHLLRVFVIIHFFNLSKKDILKLIYLILLFISSLCISLGINEEPLQSSNTKPSMFIIRSPYNLYKVQYGRTTNVLINEIFISNLTFKINKYLIKYTRKKDNFWSFCLLVSWFISLFVYLFYYFLIKSISCVLFKVFFLYHFPSLLNSIKWVWLLSITQDGYL